VPKILYVCHNHPENRPGGAEIYAYELFQAIRAAGEYEAVFVAKTGPPMSSDKAHDGTRFGLMDGRLDEYLFYTDRDEFDLVMGTARRKGMYIDDWRAFLEAQRPDVIHFQHLVHLGYDMIREARRVLPDVVIVYTLHEFVPICHHDGQMIRTETFERCDASSPRRCHECFPAIPAQTFFLRERFVKSAFDLVDMFITPSQHARRRYVDWGIRADKILCENYGRVLAPAIPGSPDAGRRGRIGFIGQITRYKGLDVLLEAMKLLARDKLPVQLIVHGPNLQRLGPQFRARLEGLIADTAGSVRLAGRYTQAELPELLSALDWVVVPSIWWENSPLVIQEAKMHRRPVICSDVGGMAENVRDGVDGLHFRVGDPFSLADTIKRAVTDPGLWETLQGNITGPYSMDDHLATIVRTYEALLDRAAAVRP
jgi:glycosyltransferase involved in cell wall biosynthesis